MFGNKKRIEKQQQEIKQLRTREKDVSQLVDNFQQQIKALEAQLKEKKVEYVVVRPPEKNDLLEYNRQLKDIVKNPFYLSYFEQVKREIITDFTKSIANSPDYYKGQLRLLGKIFADSRDAEMIYDAMLEVEPMKEGQ